MGKTESCSFARDSLHFRCRGVHGLCS